MSWKFVRRTKRISQLPVAVYDSKRKCQVFASKPGYLATFENGNESVEVGIIKDVGFRKTILWQFTCLDTGYLISNGWSDSTLDYSIDLFTRTFLEKYVEFRATTRFEELVNKFSQLKG